MKRQTQHRVNPAWIILTLLLAVGCQEHPEQQLAGGTMGIVQLNGTTLPDLQVNVYCMKEGETVRIAYGVSNSYGEFSLIHDAGQSSFELSPGHYVFTIESVAADPIPIPVSFGNPRTTPLTKDWTTSDTELELHIKRTTAD